MSKSTEADADMDDLLSGTHWKAGKYITPEDFTTPLYRQIAEMIVLQYHEGGVNPAKLLNQFVDSEEQKEVAGLFNARIPLETEEENARAA